MARVSKATAEAVAWQAVGYLAARRKGDRDLLAEGAVYPVDLRLVGRACRRELNVSIAGDVKVGHSQEVSSSSAPDVNLVLGHLRAADPGLFDRVLAGLREHLETQGFVEPVEEEHYEAAKAALKLLRQPVRVIRRGAVRFAA